MGAIHDRLELVKIENKSIEVLQAEKAREKAIELGVKGKLTDKQREETLELIRKAGLPLYKEGVTKTRGEGGGRFR